MYGKLYLLWHCYCSCFYFWIILYLFALSSHILCKMYEFVALCNTQYTYNTMTIPREIRIILYSTGETWGVLWLQTISPLNLFPSICSPKGFHLIAKLFLAALSDINGIIPEHIIVVKENYNIPSYNKMNNSSIKDATCHCALPLIDMYISLQSYCYKASIHVNICFDWMCLYQVVGFPTWSNCTLKEVEYKDCLGLWLIRIIHRDIILTRCCVWS